MKSYYVRVEVCFTVAAANAVDAEQCVDKRMDQLQESLERRSFKTEHSNAELKSLDNSHTVKITDITD